MLHLRLKLSLQNIRVTGILKTRVRLSVETSRSVTGTRMERHHLILWKLAENLSWKKEVWFVFVFWAIVYLLSIEIVTRIQYQARYFTHPLCDVWSLLDLGQSLRYAEVDIGPTYWLLFTRMARTLTPTIKWYWQKY